MPITPKTIYVKQKGFTSLLDAIKSNSIAKSCRSCGSH